MGFEEIFATIFLVSPCPAKKLSNCPVSNFAVVGLRLNCFEISFNCLDCLMVKPDKIRNPLFDRF